MSDFDKEAEREKLREKFARDEEKRERTSRMSELLLKGATMTNKHHDCGSPIFRWDGEEFCPTCHGGPEAAEGMREGGESGAQEAEGAQQTGAGTSGTSPDATERDSDTDPTVGVETPENGETPEPEPRTTEVESTTHREPATEPGPEPAPEPDRQPPRRSSTGGAGADSGTSDDVAAARASLERTLAAVAREAERTDDLSRKRDYLAAAKEAAEALEAAKRAAR